MKNYIFYFSSIFALFLSMNTYAATVTYTNTFSAGTPAVAADVNQNFTDAKTAVDANDTAITANTAAIATKAALGTNKTIDQNETDIATKADATATTNALTGKAAIGTNKTIDQNEADISTNAVAISVNAAAVATKADLGTNKTIDQNETDIATNAVAITATQNAAFTCPADMARVGPLCVDIYEATIWDAPAAGAQLSSPYGCNVNGNDCAAMFAQSVSGFAPAATVTWFQAQQACANVGKRLLSNAEWQMAAAGTPDPVTSPDTALACNVSSGAVVNTGTATTNCESRFGVRDMVGNVHEWVADWVPGSSGQPTTPASSKNSAAYGNDGVAHIDRANSNGAAYSDPAAGSGVENFPAAVYRGGAFGAGDGAGVFSFNAAEQPSFSASILGFRCAR